MALYESAWGCTERTPTAGLYSNALLSSVCYVQLQQRRLRAGTARYFLSLPTGLASSVLRTGPEECGKESSLVKPHRHPLRLASVSSDRDNDILFAFM